MPSESERIIFIPAQKASLKDILSLIKQAVEFRIERKKRRRWEAMALAIETLKPANLREAMRIVSSVNYGGWILDNVFPKSEHPDDFHSTEGAICLTDHPMQVLGWQQKDRLVEEGVEQGFGGDWINWGFEAQAAKRGIDLEWSFFSTPPDSSEQPVEINQLLERYY